jgi:uncharacterized protein YneR
MKKKHRGLLSSESYSFKPIVIKKIGTEKKIMGINFDVRTKDCVYVTMGDWTINIDNSTNEKIITSWNKNN